MGKPCWLCQLWTSPAINGLRLVLQLMAVNPLPLPDPHPAFLCRLMFSRALPDKLSACISDSASQGVQIQIVNQVRAENHNYVPPRPLQIYINSQ